MKPLVPCHSFTACKRSLNGVEIVISAKLPDISRPQFHLPPLGALAWWHAWRRLVTKVGTSNQDHTISLKAAVRSCRNKQTTRPTTFHVCKTRGCYCSFRLLMMGCVLPDTCWASYKYGIINFDTLLHLVGFFYMNCYSWTLPLIIILFQIDGNKPYFVHRIV